HCNQLRDHHEWLRCPKTVVESSSTFQALWRCDRSGSPNQGRVVMQVSMSTLDIDVAESACARPWAGRSFVVQPRAQAARCFVAETGEERLWRALVPGLFAPGPHASRWSRAVRHVLVVPLAHVTFLNLDYQIYLNQVMHTSAGAWLGHLLLIPLNVALLFYALTVHVGVGAALVLLAALATWY